MGHSEVFIKLMLTCVSLAHFFDFTLCLSPSYTTMSSDGERWRQSILGVLLQDKSSSEGSGTSLENGENPQNPVNIIIVTSMATTNPGPTENCSSGVSSCFSSSSLNGTNLVWKDMKRTLSFAWELHVFGSASLFLLLGLLGILGVIRACTLSFPLREVLTLTYSLVVISVSIRAVLFLLDPYGTRQLLSRASFTAMYNVSLHLLLWAQASLSLLTLRGLTLLFFHLDVQHLWVVSALAITHCIPLVVADLYPSVIYHVLPLLLQTLSLCWGIPLGIGMIMRSFANLQHLSRSSLPKWMPSRSVQMCAMRVTAVCALLGILSSILHMYSLLWLYGLLGNWRHFRWDWWLCQFWGRILELFWGFSLIVLGTWISCTFSRCTSKNGHSYSKDTCMVDNALPKFRNWPLRKSEKTWEELMPNNWSKYKLSRAGVSSVSLYDDQLDCSDPVTTTSCDSQAAVLWQKIGEKECVLSLIEFDMVPPSPINLRRSIDNALHHGPMLPGGLFIAPPPSWTQAVTGTNNTDGDDILPPAYSSFDWSLDKESFTASLDHFQTSETPWFTSDQNNMPTYDSDDDITNL